MKAYDLCMGIIFINIGFAFLGAFFNDAFTSEVTGHASSIQTLQTVLTTPLFSVGGFSFTTMWLLAGAMVVGTFLILNSKPGPSSQGIAYAAFTIVFWGGMTSTWVILTGFDIPGVNFIYTMFVLIATLVFVIALVQMATGGQKTHV